MPRADFVVKAFDNSCRGINAGDEDDEDVTSKRLVGSTRFSGAGEGEVFCGGLKSKKILST